MDSAGSGEGESERHFGRFLTNARALSYRKMTGLERKFLSVGEIRRGRSMGTFVVEGYQQCERILHSVILNPVF